MAPGDSGRRAAAARRGDGQQKGAALVSGGGVLRVYSGRRRGREGAVAGVAAGRTSQALFHTNLDVKRHRSHPAYVLCYLDCLVSVRVVAIVAGRAQEGEVLGTTTARSLRTDCFCAVPCRCEEGAPRPPASPSRLSPPAGLVGCRGYF